MDDKQVNVQSLYAKVDHACLVGGEAAGGDPSQAYFSRYAPADDVAVPSVLAFLPFRPLLLTKPTEG